MKTYEQKPWAKAKNLLCIRLDNRGDVLMMSPALNALKHQVEGRKITLLCSPGGAEMAALIDSVDAIIPFKAPWIKQEGGSENPQSLARLSRQLQNRKFEGAVIFNSYSQSPLPAAFLCTLAGIPLRLAFCHENPYALLSDWVRDPEPENRILHEVQRQLSLVRMIGVRTPLEACTIRVSPKAFANVSRILKERGIREDLPIVLVHPGASAPSRRYPPDKFVSVVHKLSQAHEYTLLLSGDEKEAPLCRFIAEHSKASPHILAGTLQLEELAALISLSSLLISNNTAPIHIASALSTPVLVLYALTNPQHTPWKVRNRILFKDVPCKFCYKSICPKGHHRCLGIPPEEVVAAALKLLRNPLKNRRRKIPRAS